MLGDFNTRDPFDGQETFEVDQIILHQSFSNLNGILDNDLALVRLALTANFNPRIGPICLPTTTGKILLRTG